MNNSLMIPDKKKLGKAMVKAALNNQRERLQGKAIESADFALKTVNNMNSQIVHCEETRDFYQRQLRAIESGEFSLDEYTGVLKFTEQELNERR